MGTRSTMVAFAFAVAFLVTGAEPVAGKMLRDRGDVVQSVLVDGSRAVWQRPDGAILARDDQTGVQQAFGGDGCLPLGVRDTLVLLRCAGGEASLLSVDDGRRRSVADWQPGMFYSSIGRYWLSGQDCNSGRESCPGVYLNWRSGERVAIDVARDLDSPALAELPRTPRRPYVRTGVPRDEAAERADISLVTRRGAIVLSRCRRGCTSITSHSGLVSWIEGATVRGYNIASRRFLSFSAAGFKPTFAAHTAHRVYARSKGVIGGSGSLRVASWR